MPQPTKDKGSAQNSIRSLVKADTIGCYASEFDVWMTPDSVLIVNHDPTINGVEIQKTPSNVVLKQKLANGETVPTLEQYYFREIPINQFLNGCRITGRTDQQ